MSVGLGFGGYLLRAGRSNLALDVTVNNIVYDNEWDSELNILSKVDLNYKYKFNSTLAVFVGPSFNTYNTEVQLEEGGAFGTLDIPYTLFEDEMEDGAVYLWLGGNLGLSITL